MSAQTVPPPREMPGQGVPAAYGAASDGRWLHDLRNAVNTASVAAAVARRMLEAGMDDSAAEMLDDLERACRRCSTLLAAPPDRVLRGG